MAELATVFGSLVCLFSLFAIIFPNKLLSAAQGITITTRLRFTASAVRILLGIVFVQVAASTRFPLTLQIVGVVLIARGVTVLLLGNTKTQSLLDWVVRQGPGLIMAGGIGGLLFGGFIVYAVVGS